MTSDDMIRLRCRYCNDVIGVYEPIVRIDDGDRQVTSLASEPWLHTAQVPCYHHSCYEQLSDSPDRV